MTKEKADEIIIKNQSLVYYVMKKYFKFAYHDLELKEELSSVGTEGLIKAAYNFDETTGYKFSTYAVSSIWGNIQKYLRDNNSIRYTRRLIDLGNQIKKELNTGDLTLEDLNVKFNSLDLTSDDKLGLTNYIFGTDSIDRNVSVKEGEVDLIDVLPHYEQHVIDDLIVSDYINNVSRDDRDKKLIDYLIQGYTQEQIASKFNVSQCHISRLQTQIKCNIITYLIVTHDYITACNLLKIIPINEITLIKKYKIPIHLIPLSILNKHYKPINFNDFLDEDLNLAEIKAYETLKNIKANNKKINTNIIEINKPSVEIIYSKKQFHNLLIRIIINLMLHEEINNPSKDDILEYLNKNYRDIKINEQLNKITKQQLISFNNRCINIIKTKELTKDCKILLTTEDVALIERNITIKYISNQILDILKQLKSMNLS